MADTIWLTGSEVEVIRRASPRSSPVARVLDDRARLLELVEKLVAACQDYGEHEDGCVISEQWCSCGWIDRRRGLDTEARACLKAQEQ